MKQSEMNAQCTISKKGSIIIINYKRKHSPTMSNHTKEISGNAGDVMQCDDNDY